MPLPNQYSVEIITKGEALYWCQRMLVAYRNGIPHSIPKNRAMAALFQALQVLNQETQT
nr:MAG TPA: hypothetical protein [Caudoviricetes sp.]